MFWNGLRQQTAQLSDGRAARAVGHHVCDEARLSLLVLVRPHDGLSHPVDSSQRRFDLSQLHPEAAQLHLSVAAAEVLQIAARLEAHAVAGPVDALLPPRKGSGMNLSAVRSARFRYPRATPAPPM